MFLRSPKPGECLFQEGLLSLTVILLIPACLADEISHIHTLGQAAGIGNSWVVVFRIEPLTTHTHRKKSGVSLAEAYRLPEYGTLPCRKYRN
jgi:hypothetical protein